MQLQRTFSAPKDIVSLSSQHLADPADAMTGAAHDFLDRHAVLCQRHDGRVGLFPTEIAFLLKAIGRSQQLRIHKCEQGGFDDDVQAVELIQEYKADAGAAGWQSRLWNWSF